MSKGFSALPPKADFPILELLPPPAFGERRHGGLARRLVAVGRRAIFVIAKSALIGSASAAIERFANGIGNDARPSAALTAADDISRCIIVCDGQFQQAIADYDRTLQVGGSGLCEGIL